MTQSFLIQINADSWNVQNPLSTLPNCHPTDKYIFVSTLETVMVYKDFYKYCITSFSSVFFPNDMGPGALPKTEGK